MVDKISGSNIQDAQLLQVGTQQSVETSNQQAAQDSASAASFNTLDQATISDAAKQAYEQEKETLKFSRLAMRIQEPYDADKVSRMKDLVNSGRINDYLRNLDTGSIADNMLNSAAGGFLS